MGNMVEKIEMELAMVKALATPTRITGPLMSLRLKVPLIYEGLKDLGQASALSPRFWARADAAR